MSVVLYQYMAAWYADVQLTVLHKHLTGLYNMTAGLWPGYAHCETKVQNSSFSVEQSSIDNSDTVVHGVVVGEAIQDTCTLKCIKACIANHE